MLCVAAIIAAILHRHETSTLRSAVVQKIVYHCCGRQAILG
jgi:hypothetical protein